MMKGEPLDTDRTVAGAVKEAGTVAEFAERYETVADAVDGATYEDIENDFEEWEAVEEAFPDYEALENYVPKRKRSIIDG